jgi:hypothetical protein
MVRVHSGLPFKLSPPVSEALLSRKFRVLVGILGPPNLCFAFCSPIRNHGLITGWRLLGTLSNRMETIVVRVLSDSWFLPCQGSVKPHAQQLPNFTANG